MRAPKQVKQQDLTEFEGMDPLVLDRVLEHQKEQATDGIRAIVQTETFARDDDEKLTAEEQKEVRRIISDEKLKREDPQKWAKLLYQRQQAQLRELPRYAAPHAMSVPSRFAPASHSQALQQPGHGQGQPPLPSTSFANGQSNVPTLRLSRDSMLAPQLPLDYNPEGYRHSLPAGSSAAFGAPSEYLGNRYPPIPGAGTHRSQSPEKSEVRRNSEAAPIPTTGASDDANIGPDRAHLSATSTGRENPVPETVRAFGAPSTISGSHANGTTFGAPSTPTLFGAHRSVPAAPLSQSGPSRLPMRQSGRHFPSSEPTKTRAGIQSSQPNLSPSLVDVDSQQRQKGATPEEEMGQVS